MALTVRDDGPGVPADIQPRLFEPFFSTKDGGAGLGLATVGKIASSCGGFATADNPPGGGARFEVLIPAEWPRDHTREAAAEAPPEGAGNGSW